MKSFLQYITEQVIIPTTTPVAPSYKDPGNNTQGGGVDVQQNTPRAPGKWGSDDRWKDEDWKDGHPVCYGTDCRPVDENGNYDGSGRR